MLMEKYWKQMFIFGAIAVSAVDRIGGFKKIVSTKFIQFIKMFLKVTVCVLGLFISAALSASVDCNIEQCAKPLKVYEELGCKAVLGSRSCCAKRFDCPDFTKLDENKCSFGDKEYNIGEILPRQFTDSAKCVETCFCTREDNQPAKFTCTKSDCGVSSLKVPGCLNIYGDLNECCSTSIVCEDDEKESLATCHVGKEYREGEKFTPDSNPCYECLCHKDFDNTTAIADNPHCRKLNCEIDLRYKSNVQRGCLPVFHSEKCCPVDWECPKIDKKIVKRSADDDGESYTPKTNVYVVTPSKNLEEYLAEVKLSNEKEFLSSTAKTVTEVKEEIKLATTEAALIPTLSSNPFLPPSIGEVTASVSVPVSDKVEDETTTQSIKALFDAVVATDTTQASTSSAFEPTTSSAALSSVESSVVESTSAISTHDSTTPESTTHDSTTSSTTTEKSEEKDSDEDDSEEENTNLFGEEVSDSEKETPTVIPSSTEAATSEAPSTSTSTDLPSTTETGSKAGRVLEQPEDLTTLTPEFTTTTVHESSTTVHESSPLIHDSSSSVHESSSTVHDTTTAAQESSSATTTSEAPPSSSSPTATTEFVLLSQEIYTSVAPTEASLTTQESTSQAPVTQPTYVEKKVFPTEFEALLTTLREFVDKADAITSIETPSTSVQSGVSSPKVEQQVEFVNYTVSTEKHHEEVHKDEEPPKTEQPETEEPLKTELPPKTEEPHRHVDSPILEELPRILFKRSVRDADLIPRYYKPIFSVNKDKTCEFNGRSYKVGEVIKTDNECLKCLCEFAPIGHCMLKEKCNF